MVNGPNDWIGEVSSVKVTVRNNLVNWQRIEVYAEMSAVASGIVALGGLPPPVTPEHELVVARGSAIVYVPPRAEKTFVVDLARDVNVSVPFDYSYFPRAKIVSHETIERP